MATAEELRQAVTAGRLALAAAIESAAAGWESSFDGGWTPRQIAEHCIERDFGLAGIARAAIERRAPELEFARTNDPDAPVQLALPSAADAASTLTQSGLAFDQAVGSVSDRDLARPAELNAGPLPKTIEGVLRLAAWHLDDHAAQIVKAQPPAP